MAGLPKIGVQAVVENSDGYLKAIKDIERANDQAADSVKNTAKTFDVLNDSTDYARSVQKRYSETLKDARSSMDQAVPGISGMEIAFGALGVAVIGAQVAFAAFSAVLGAIGSVISGVVNIIGGVINAIASFAKAIVDSIGNAFNFVKDIVVDVGNHLIDFGKTAVEKGMAFSKVMSNISAVSGKTGTALQSLSNDLINIGANAVAGPTAVADAYYDVASGITNTRIAMDVLKASIATAEAGQANLKDTTNGLISVMNSYNGTAKDAAHYSDVFTQTVNKGKGTMDQFVSALSPLASMAATSKISFDELGGAMSFMTQKGLTAAQAGTALSGIITQLSRNTPGVTRALRSMGETSVEASIANNGLAGTLNLLVQGAKKTGQNLQTLVGRVEAMKAVTILGANEFQNYFKTFMDGIDEATSKAREIQRLDVGAQFQLFQARLEGVSLSISQAVLPALNKFLQFFNKSFARIDWKKIGAGLQILGEKLGESAGNLVDKLSSWLDKIDWNQLAQQATDFLSSVGDAIAGIDWNAVLDGVSSFVATIGDILSPIGNLFANIDWQKAYDDGTKVFSDIASFIGSIDWKGLVQVVADVAAGIGTFIASIDWAQVGADVAMIITNVTDAFKTVGNFIANVDWATLGTNASQAITTITDAISAINWQQVVDQALAFLQGAATFFQTLNTAVSTTGMAIKIVSDQVSAAFDAIRGAAAKLAAVIGGIINAIASAIVQGLGPAGQAIQQIANALGSLGGGGGGGTGSIGFTDTGTKGGGTTSGSKGGGGKVGHKATGGQLQRGWTVVGEKGPELINYTGGMAMVYANERSHGMVQQAEREVGRSGGTTKSKGIIKAALSKSITWGGGGNAGGGSGGGGGWSVAPAMPPGLNIKDYIAKVGYEAWSHMGKGIMPGAMPIPVGAGDNNSSSNVTNNRNIENVNFYGGQNNGSAMERFARMRMIRKL